MQMPDTWLAAQKIALFEGFKPIPYLDSAGIPTIGYGTIRYPNGKAVTLNDPECTPTQALDYLNHDLADCAKNLWVALTRQPGLHQWSAMLSLAYNIGWPSITKSTVVRMFNAGDFDASAKAFEMWDKAHVNGQLVTVQGLLNRRKAEETLFLTPDDGL